MQALAVDKHVLLVRRRPVKGSGPESPDLCLQLANSSAAASCQTAAGRGQTCLDLTVPCGFIERRELVVQYKAVL